MLGDNILFLRGGEGRGKVPEQKYRDLLGRPCGYFMLQQLTPHLPPFHCKSSSLASTLLSVFISRTHHLHPSQVKLRKRTSQLYLARASYGYKDTVLDPSLTFQPPCSASQKLPDLNTNGFVRSRFPDYRGCRAWGTSSSISPGSSTSPSPNTSSLGVLQLAKIIVSRMSRFLRLLEVL